MAKKFIQSAIKRPGALTRKAKAAGESVSKFAASHKGASGKTGQQARFYENVLAKVRRPGRHRTTRATRHGMEI